MEGRFSEILKAYRAEKIKLGITTDLPFSYEEERLSESGVIVSATASSFLTNADTFWRFSESSLPAIKPILLYYSFVHFTEFCSTLFYRVENRKKAHGLRLPVDITEKDSVYKVPKHLERLFMNLKVRIRPAGTFARLVDYLTVTGNPNRFSPIIVSTGSGKHPLSCEEFRLFENPVKSLVYSSGPSLSVTEILNYDLDLTEQEKHVFSKQSFDPSPIVLNSHLPMCLLTIFIACHLARYEPTFWQHIYSGTSTEALDDLNEDFALYKRVLRYTNVLMSHFKHCLYVRAGNIDLSV